MAWAKYWRPCWNGFCDLVGNPEPLCNWRTMPVVHGGVGCNDPNLLAGNYRQPCSQETKSRKISIRDYCCLEVDFDGQLIPNHHGFDIYSLARFLAQLSFQGKKHD